MVADEPSAIASSQRPKRNIIAGSAGGPPAWLITPAVSQAPSATLPWPCGRGLALWNRAPACDMGAPLTRGGSSNMRVGVIKHGAAV